MKNIVVGLDGSEHSMVALSWAQTLARTAPGTLVHLVHAFWVPAPATEVEAYSYAEQKEKSRAEAWAMLNRAADSLTGVVAERHLVEGPPVRVLLEVAREVGAELIAVGRRGRGALASILLGSVSSGVVHAAHAPVLVVHDAPARPIRRVLVGVDGSAHSAKALAFAAVWTPEAVVTALHVVPSAPHLRAIFVQQGMSYDAAVDRAGQDVVKRAVELAGVSPGRMEAMGVPGNAAEQLVSEFRHGGYDLAVVGSRGLGTIGELILGSVSERMLRTAPGPVVVVK